MVRTWEYNPYKDVVPLQLGHGIPEQNYMNIKPNKGPSRVPANPPTLHRGQGARKKHFKPLKFKM